MIFLCPQPDSFQPSGNDSYSMVFSTKNGDDKTYNVQVFKENGRLFVFNYTTRRNFEIKDIPNPDIRLDERTGEVVVEDSNNPMTSACLTLYLEIGTVGMALYRQLAAEMLDLEAS